MKKLLILALIGIVLISGCITSPDSDFQDTDTEEEKETRATEQKLNLEDIPKSNIIATFIDCPDCNKKSHIPCFDFGEIDLENIEQSNIVLYEI